MTYQFIYGDYLSGRRPVKKGRIKRPKSRVSKPRTIGNTINLNRELQKKNNLDPEIEYREKIGNQRKELDSLLNRQEKMSAEISKLEKEYDNLEKEFDKYRLEVERREAGYQGGFFTRIVGGPFRLAQSILSRESRNKETKISNQRKELNSLLNKMKELRKISKNQSKEIKMLKENSETWRHRFNKLRKDTREEKNLGKDPLIRKLQSKINKQDVQIDKLQDELRYSHSGEQNAKQPLESVLEALKRADEEFGNLLILDSCWKSAKKSFYRDPELVYKTLQTMSKEATIWQKYVEGTGSYEDHIGTQLDIANHDSKDRFWNNGDISEKMNKHIKLGVDHNPQNTLRIYYDIKRIGALKIAYCGEHPK